MYQKMTIVGNLGGEPRLNDVKGKKVCNFSVATNRRWNNQDGSQGEETTWFRVAVWGGQAEACAQYLSKGRAVLVEGTLVPDPDTGGPRIYTDKEGYAAASFEIRAITVKFLPGSKGEGEGNGSNGKRARVRGGSANSAAFDNPGDIPFGDEDSGGEEGFAGLKFDF